MSDLTDAGIKQVLAALEVFSGKPDRASLEKANAWLQTFQHSVRLSWMIPYEAMDVLLTTSLLAPLIASSINHSRNLGPLATSYFYLQTCQNLEEHSRLSPSVQRCLPLRSPPGSNPALTESTSALSLFSPFEVTHDLHQLDPQQRAGLRDTLLSAIQQYAAGPRVVLIQICLAMSGLALQMREWDNAIMDVVNVLGQNPTTVPALLQFLTLLPEEISSNTRIPLSVSLFQLLPPSRDLTVHR